LSHTLTAAAREAPRGPLWRVTHRTREKKNSVLLREIGRGRLPRVGDG